jgi:hypothetical protein
MATLPRLNLTNLRFKPDAGGLARAIPFPAAAPILINRKQQPMLPPVTRRTRIWELSSHFHCSIVGTCLSTAELRQVLAKARPAADAATEHELHGLGVLVAGQHDAASKLLHKALDKRHALAIRQFDKAKTVEDLRGQWRDAVKRSEIPGAYWAVLTHPTASEALVREVFGEVHMLSHLVGAANRADIGRLSQLEAENAALREKAQRQQDLLREAIVSRDAKIRDLNALLARRIADAQAAAPASDGTSEHATLAHLIGDRERRLSAETNRRAYLERRVERLVEELREARSRIDGAEQGERALREELEAIEAGLAPAIPDHTANQNDAATTPTLAGVALLYVGGRVGSLPRLREVATELGAELLHHDGGVEDRSGMLAGLVNRADVVMFPVDCVSHEAVGLVKRLCRQADKPYLALRSTGIGSFVAALGRAEIAALRTNIPALSPA